MSANVTDAGGAASTDLTAINVMTYAFLAVVTFGIGAGIEVSAVRDVFRRRKAAFAIGLATQYVVVPGVARGVSAALGMPDLDAFGVILLGCCPGGATSNAFAYFARGDLALSISMTAVSNALAFGTLPALLLLWTRGLTDVAYRIPFLEIFASLLLVLLPAAAGIWLRTARPGWGRRAEKLGALSGGVLVVSSLFAGLIQNRDTLADPGLFPWKNALAVGLIAPIGMLAALLAVRALRRCADVPLPVMATVLLETGVQNTVIGLAIATLSTAGDAFSAREAFRLQLIMIAWGVIVSFEALAVTVAFRWLLRGERAGATARDVPGGGVEAAIIGRSDAA